MVEGGVSVGGAVLAQAVAMARGAVDRRNDIPILQTLHIANNGDHLRVTGTDLDHYIGASVPVETSGKEWKPLAVNAEQLHQIMGLYPKDATVELVARNQDLLDIRCGNHRGTLNTLDVTTWPDVPRVEWVNVCEIEGSVLADALDYVRPSIASDQSRPFLQGVYLDISEDGLYVVATDGHTLRHATTNLAPAGLEGMPGVIIPARAVNLFLAAAKRNETKLTFSISPEKVALGTEQFEILCRTLDFDYPDWRRISEFGEVAATMQVEGESAVMAAKRASLATDHLNVLRLDVDKIGVKLSTRNSAKGESTDWLKPSLLETKEDFVCGFDPGYLVAAFEQAGSQTATMEICTSNGGRGRVTFGDGGKWCLIMGKTPR